MVEDYTETTVQLKLAYSGVRKGAGQNGQQMKVSNSSIFFVGYLILLLATA
jgi:hypothetical protein